MRRIPELDALRGVSAVVIVLFHLRYMKQFPLWGSAVDLFFVLSGYLITTIILTTSDRPGFFRNFYARRSLRIWPIYYLFIGLAFAVNASLPVRQPMEALPYFLTYTQFIQAYWFADFPHCSTLFGHTWTLAIEEQFYLFWPLLVKLAGRRGLPALIVPLLVMPAAMRYLGFNRNLLLTRCDGLVLGAALALLFLDRGRVARHRRLFGAAFAMVIGATLSYPWWRQPLWELAHRAWPETWAMAVLSADVSRICLFYAGVVGLVLTLAGHPLLRPLRNRRLCYLGQISYGLYLYHPLLFVLVSLIPYRFPSHDSVYKDVLRLAATLAVASLSWRFIEKPILALKDRFGYETPPGPRTLRGPHVARGVRSGVGED